MRTTTTKQIAAMNDQLRQRVGIPVFGTPAVPGRILFTAGVCALPPEVQIVAWLAVRDFATFNEDNNPHGEHDFGAIELPGGVKIFWKIDYYEDASMTFGADDPSDPKRSFRVLTIMLASEY